MTSLQMDNYHIRPSFFSLVELSLLARIYEEQCVPSATHKNINQGSLAQTLLKMKATEQTGTLRVAIFGSEIVGFLWKLDGVTLAHWVHGEHRHSQLSASLLSQ